MTEKTRRRGAIALIAIVYATMLMFGLVENIKSVAYPLIKGEFAASYSAQGGLVSVSWFGYVIFCMAAGFFQHRFGGRNTLLMGYGLVIAGAAATLAAPSFWAVSATMIIINMGFGFFEVGTNALGTRLFTTRTALMMSLMHFFYGFGAIAGPKAAGLMIGTLSFGWRQVYLAIIIPLGLLFLFILTRRGHETAVDDKPVPGALTFWGAFRTPLVWVFALTLGFMEVVEFGAANWGGLHLKDVYGLNPETTGATFVSAFYVLFTLARLFGGLAVERLGYVRSLYISIGGTLLVYLVGFALGLRGIWVLPVSGLFIAVMWPTMLAVAMKAFGSDAPNATSAIITLSGAVNGVMQWVIGLINQGVGEAWGYRSCIFWSVIMLAAMVLLQWWLKARPYRLGGQEVQHG